MATTKNKNLFYQLYSKDNSIANSGYVCQSALNENDTSFDISGSEAQITDSNGDILASVDLSEIHAAGIKQYNVETKILQPHSAYLLQGQEFGETYKSQFFLVHKIMCNIENYQDYCNLQFDILYKQKGKKCNVHVNTRNIRETYGSFTILVQNQLNKLHVPVSISVKIFDDENSSESQLEYINFQSTEEGYDFIVRNVILTPITKNDVNNEGEIGEFIDSPFTGPDITNSLILDILDEIQPSLINQDPNKKYMQAYKIGCDIYRALMKLSLFILDDFNTFCYELDILKKHFIPCFDKDGELIFTKKFNDVVIQKYPQIYIRYFNLGLEKYNINDIVKILDKLQEHIFTMKNTMGPSYCYEDINRRVDYVKYPNGACRGIILIPNWPTDEEYESSVLWVNHVADKVEICVPVDIETLNKYYEGHIVSRKKARLFEKAIASVKINALIPSEKQQYIEDYDNLPLNDISSNDGFTNSFDNLQVAGYDTQDFIYNDFHRLPVDQDKYNWEEPIKYHDPEMFIESTHDNDDIWENNPNKTNVRFVDTHENLSEKIIGLYKYMEYLSNNDIWIRCGKAYMVIGKDDNFQLKTKNLLQSLLVYNPNDVPIKIKYIVFS